MEWIKIDPEKGSKINEQVIALMSDQSVTPVVLFAIKENKDGSKLPLFLVSQNFRDPEFFVNDFTRLLGEHAKFNQVRKEESTTPA